MSVVRVDVPRRQREHMFVGHRDAIGRQQVHQAPREIPRRALEAPVAPPPLEDHGQGDHGGPLDGGETDWCSASAPRLNRDHDGTGHPHQKPVAVDRWLVRLSSPRGGVVLVPHGGSGTTGVAAIAEGRRVILCERVPEYAAMIRARCEAATNGGDWRAPDAAPSLFGGAA